MTTDKIFKITLLSLLVLILGALIGIILALYVPYAGPEDYLISLEQDEIDDLGFISPDDHYRYDLYNYQEFGRLVDESINSFDDVLIWADEAGYEMYQEDEFFIFESDEICEVDEIRGREVCFIQILEVSPYDNMVAVIEESLE